MFDAGLRLFTSALSVAGCRLATMRFHRVLPTPDTMRPFEPDAKRFEAEMRWVSSAFRVLPLAEAVDQLQRGTLPPRALTVTFDDGYRDNLTIAQPIMRKLGLPFTVFVTTHFCDGSLMWNDAVIEALRASPEGPLTIPGLPLDPVFVSEQTKPVVADQILTALKYLPQPERAALAGELLARSAAKPQRLMMTRDEIRALSENGAEIGGHTCSHPILTTLAETAARREIEDNKTELQTITGRTVRLFAYPNGRPDVDYGTREIELVRSAGYEAALSTATGTATSSNDIYQLPRFTPWDRTKNKYLLRMMLNFARGPQALSQNAIED